MRKLIVLLFCAFYAILCFSRDEFDGSTLSEEEMKLYNLVMQYRASMGLYSIPLSKSLTYVAQVHVRDLDRYYSLDNNGICNMHSWSSNGNWSSCCYTSDHARATCMWNKPSELTSYRGRGYEIAYASYGNATADGALEGWKKSPKHHETIINQGIWQSRWNAIGVGIYNNYAVIWFGREQDTEPVIPCIVSDFVYSNGETKNIIKNSAYAKEDNREVSSQSVIKSNLTVEPQPNKSNYSTNSASGTSNENSVKNSNDTPNTLWNSNKTTKKARHKFYDYSGKRFLSIVNASYSYDFGDARHMMLLGVLGFRYKMFGFSLLDFEMGVFPFSKSFGWSPKLELYIPISKSFSINMHAGTSVDITYLGQYLLNDYTYSDANFYVSGVWGISLYHAGLRNLPFKFFCEYRYPFMGTFQSKGFYVGFQMSPGLVFN